MSICISKPEIIYENGEVRYCVNVRFSDRSESLWYTLSEEHGDLISERSDAPLTALLILAMARNEDIYVEGIVSEKLYHNLSGLYQSLLQNMIPSLKLRRVNIYPAEVQPAYMSGSGIATGFSGGFDSFCVLADHWYTDTPKEGLRLTHLLFNNVGAHGYGGNGRRLFRERYARVKPAADRIGLPFIAVDSNINDFYKMFSYQQTYTPRNASVGLLLQRGIGHYLYASTFHYKDLFIGPSYDMALSDPIALSLLSTEAIDIRSVGSEYTRVEKILRVAEIEDSHSALTVCTRDDKAVNCSVCWKCKQALLTLEIAGLLDRYSEIFDLDAYRRVRDSYIAEVLRSEDPLLREVAVFARERKFQTPDTSRLYVYMLTNSITNQARRLAYLPHWMANKVKRKP